MNSEMEGHKKHTVTHDGDGAVCHQSKLCGVTYAWDNQEDKKGKLVAGKKSLDLQIGLVGQVKLN